MCTALRLPIGLGSALVLALTMMAPAADLTHREARGAELSDKWKYGQGVVTRGSDGKVVFLFGEVQPSVVCSPLQVCDVELQPGEVVRDVMLGDTVRWKVEPATSGPVNGQAVHLVVKPAEPGLVTSMVVTTSRRTYHIQLKSHQSQYMARIGFDYPEDVNARLAEINARLQASIVPGAGIAAEQLDFAYRMIGSARWKPTRVLATDRRPIFSSHQLCPARMHLFSMFYQVVSLASSTIG